jgi:transcriptional regulator with XRE-family HTH domain
MGTRLTAARNNAGLSQAEVAEACGVNINSVFKWENGSVPAPELRAKLAVLYGLEEENLFREYEKAFEANRALLKPAS